MDGQILDPTAFFYQQIAHNALKNVDALGQGINQHDGCAGKTAEDKGQRDTYEPVGTAVEEESDTGPTAGAEGKVHREDVTLQGHIQAGDNDEPCGKGANGIGGVVKLRY